jgi:preprotein translocase subunit SecF
MKLNKKAQAWKYILAAILALITLGVIVWILFKQKTSMQGIIAMLRDII